MNLKTKTLQWCVDNLKGWPVDIVDRPAPDEWRWVALEQAENLESNIALTNGNDVVTLPEVIEHKAYINQAAANDQSKAVEQPSLALVDEFISIDQQLDKMQIRQNELVAQFLLDLKPEDKPALVKLISHTSTKNKSVNQILLAVLRQINPKS